MSRFTVHRVDKNQPEIVEELEAHGATVTPLSGNGNGVADLLVGYRGFTIPVEVKRKTGKLSKRQLEWHKGHDGLTFVVRTRQQARFVLLAVDAICKKYGIKRLEMDNFDFNGQGVSPTVHR